MKSICVPTFRKCQATLTFIILSLTGLLTAQAPTVGVLTKTDGALPGYTFFSPFSSTKAFMVDNCGNLINEWDRGTNPGLAAYFLDNGLMFRTYKVDPVGPFTSASNAGGLELVDWDNNVVWQYTINTPTQLTHHDAVMMPNGNILTLMWELTFRDELEELGRDPDEIAPQNFMWSEKILELQPIGQDSANVVWEWHINDHFIQDFDSTKIGFGVVADHPELYDLNHPTLDSGNSNETRDWFHFNAIDYNPTLDQILISIRNSDEVWIIDHSTTTEEAAGHTGGIYGQGGDILYRWGNPSAYQGAIIEEQKLFGQHGVNWIPEGLVEAGSILIFNNGNGQPGADFSQIQILSPPQDIPGFYLREEGLPFGPEEANTIYGDTSEESFYSAFLSNAQRLPEGHTLINSGSPGRIFEINSEREIVWAYEIPVNQDTPISQGDQARNNANFRAYKYAPDYTGFEDIDLTPGLPIELNPLDCSLSTSTIDLAHVPIDLHYLAETNSLRIDTDRKIQSLYLHDLYGRQLETLAHSYPTVLLNRSYTLGTYIVRIIFEDGKTRTQKVFLY
jgi:hypothetical protein